MVKVIYSGKYNEMEEIVTASEQMAELVASRILLFRKNPSDTRLDNHPLTKSMEGKWAFSITEDIRIIYKWLGRNTVRFLAIGPHADVYPTQRDKKTAD